jgi:hypothetical protein
VKVYHRTHPSRAILRDGFHDGFYLLPGIGEFHGVFVSADWPVDENEGADGDVVLELQIPDDLWAKYEWIEEDGTWRQAMIPAKDLNQCPTRVLTDAEVDALVVERFWSFGETVARRVAQARRKPARRFRSYRLPKPKVAGSRPVVRSSTTRFCRHFGRAVRDPFHR